MDATQLMRWQALALMAAVQRLGGKIEIERKEIEKLDEERKTNALELVFKAEGEKLVVFLDDSEKYW
jgi:hypothetical protein